MLGEFLQNLTRSPKKANAGLAGEDFVERICDIIGLVKGTHYKTQHKSKSGSDTDFVFPYVEDYKDIDVDIFVAVQFSSNDRFRLATSELKDGGKRYLVTGNGFDVSTKKLEDIGSQIISDAKSKKYILVCYLPEMKKEKERLEKNIREGNQKDESKKRLDFFEENTITFSEFAKRLKKRLKLTD